MTAGTVCGSCGTVLRATAKFCDECGTPIAGSGDTAEYKQVTVLFADVVRSMDIAAALDIERLREVIAELAEQGGESIARIRDSAVRVVQVVNEISQALKEQSVASNDIALNVERIAQSASGNAQAARQVAQAVSAPWKSSLPRATSLCFSGSTGASRRGAEGPGPAAGHRVVAPPGGGGSAQMSLISCRNSSTSSKER